MKNKVLFMLLVSMGLSVGCKPRNFGNVSSAQPVSGTDSSAHGWSSVSNPWKLSPEDSALFINYITKGLEEAGGGDLPKLWANGVFTVVSYSHNGLGIGGPVFSLATAVPESFISSGRTDPRDAANWKAVFDKFLAVGENRSQLMSTEDFRAKCTKATSLCEWWIEPYQDEEE